MREMTRLLAALSILCLPVLAISTSDALAQIVVGPKPLHPTVLRRPLQIPRPTAQVQAASQATPAVAPATPAQPAPQSKMMVTTVSLADIGFKNGIRFANLGGRREIFVPLPLGADLSATELVLVLDDLSAHEARRNVEVLVNDRSVAAIALDGKGNSRIVRIPLGKTKPLDGYVKLAFVYSGAATQDRCIDVRYVGDSLTLRPESGIDLEFDPATLNDVATIAALMPRDVNVLLPGHKLTAANFAAALAVARSLAATGHHASFHSGYNRPADTFDARGRRQWTRGIVVIGTPEEVTGAVTSAPNTQAAPIPGVGEINSVRIGGYPALLVSEGASVRAASLLGNPSIAAVRGLASASVVAVGETALSSERVTFDQLELAPASIEVYGRADIAVAIDTRALPADTQLSRLLLNIMVAPDGAGEKAVVSVFVNEKLLASAVAAQDEATRLDIPLPPGLIDTVANVRAVVQRRSPQGDCRFEPQGYPAQILGSSAVILSPAEGIHDFADLATRWTNGVVVMVPPAAADRPERFLGMLSDMVAGLTPELSPINVMYIDNSTPARVVAPFIVVSALPPDGAEPHVRFDRGRVMVNDRSGRTLLDIGGFNSGAVAQLVSAQGYPGIWVKPLSAEGSLPAPPALRLGRGDVAFIDQKGIALAMSTDRDTMVSVTYPDQASWITVAKRFQSWIVGALWILATVTFLYTLQRMRRRRPRSTDE